MAKWNIGPKNGLWKGGRSITSSGYVILRVGTDHHLSDSRGYAYEHRVIAEKMLGRRLKRGEIVHHKDGDKANNKKSNLEVLTHHEHHRKHHPNARGRAPGEPNKEISCGCGCGEEFKKYDTSGRPRFFRSGHNAIPTPRLRKIVIALLKGPIQIRETYKYLGISSSNLVTALGNLKKKGVASRIAAGLWVCADTKKAKQIAGRFKENQKITTYTDKLSELSWVIVSNLKNGKIHSTILSGLRKAHRMGEECAGRELDGRIHDGYPQMEKAHEHSSR